MTIPGNLVHTFTPTAGPISAVAAGQVLQDGQIDVAGGIWSINASNELVAGGSPLQATSHLKAGTAQVPDATEQRMVMRILAVQGSGTHSLIFRRQSNGDHYVAFLSAANGRVDIFSYVGGTYTLVGRLSFGGYSANDNIDLDVSCQGTTTVTFTVTVQNITTSTTILNGSTLTDSSPPAGLQGSGGYGLTTATAGDKFGPIAYYNASGGTALTAGAASLGTVTQSAIGLTATAPTGGTAPYTYQWHRSTTNGFTPGGGTVLGGATGLTYTDSTPAADTIYYYVLAQTDSAGTPATVYTAELAGTHKRAAPLIIGFLGDSITANTPSGGNTPAAEMATALDHLTGPRTVTVVNRGIGGTKASDWLPADASNNYTNAVAAFAAAGVTHVLVCLGPNDAFNGVSAATFGSNMSTIIAALVAAGYTVLVNATSWVDAPRSTWPGDVNVRLLAYRAQLDALANGTTIVTGDRLAWYEWALDSAQSGDGIHPSATGARTLGTLWALAFAKAFLGLDGGSSLVTVAQRSFGRRR